MENYLPTVSSKEELKELIDRIGFLPFFRCGINGFSLKDAADPSIWFVEGVEGPWEWKCDAGVYGKLFRGKAVFMTPEWYAILACYRRDGYDAEGMYEDGLLPHEALHIMAELEKGYAPGAALAGAGSFHGLGVLSTDLRARTGMTDKASGFDNFINVLQMKCFVLPTSFEYAIDRHGRPYGWGLARYSLSDAKYGRLIEAAEAKYTPAEAKALLIKHVIEICPNVTEKQAERLIR